MLNLLHDIARHNTIIRKSATKMMFFHSKTGFERIELIRVPTYSSSGKKYHYYLVISSRGTKKFRVKKRALEYVLALIQKEG